MVKYRLSHLTQNASQEVSGPIQDDEALLLFALIRCMRLKTVVEVGGLGGYSAKNFCVAVGSKGKVVTIDLHPLPKVARNHVVLIGDAIGLRSDAFDVKRFDLVFFDCHEYAVQLQFLRNLEAYGLVDNATVICLHDTNTHPAKYYDWAYEVPEGWVHQAVERRLVNELHELGYDAFCVHTRNDAHDATLPYRHGLTLMRKFRSLSI